MTLAHLAAVFATFILLLVVILQLFLAAGFPFGRAAWGGEHRVLPRRLRWGSLASALALGAAAWIILARVNLVAPGSARGFVGIATWVFAALFALNTLGNLVSRSKAERYLMTPATLILVVCFLGAALSPR